MISNYTVAMKTDNTIFLMRRINEKANKFLVNKLAKIGLPGLAPSHGDVIANLFKYKEITMSRLSNVIYRDPSTVTALVSKLKRMGYVQTRKDSADTRVTYVSLTDEGKALEPYFQRISLELYRLEYQGLTQEEKKTLHALLSKIHANF